jgi:plasmid stabilization system protein ParE
MAYEISWSEESVRNLDDIITYLRFNWSENEVSFKDRLRTVLDLIQENLLIFQESKGQNGTRKAVVTYQTSVIYTIEEHKVYVIYLLANKTNRPY